MKDVVIVKIVNSRKKDSNLFGDFEDCDMFGFYGCGCACACVYVWLLSCL